MSGVMDFVFPKPVLQGPIEKKLALEDNKRIVRSIGAGQVAGAWFIAWVLTLPPFIPDILIVDNPPPDNDTIIVVFDPPKPRPGPKPKPAVRPPHENKGRLAQSNNPTKETGVIKLNLIESRTDKLLGKAFEMIKSIGHGLDQEKIERAGGLTRTDETRLSGRVGVKRDGFGVGYGDGTGESNDIDLTPGSLGPIETDDSRLSDMGKASQISMATEERFRSSDEILAVVRSHAPGLRHLYNTHLKMNPGMSGKVTIRFAISPSGRVVDAAIASGTTGSPRFEQEVLRKILAWRFESIKAVGNDIVTVPFNFSE